MKEEEENLLNDEFHFEFCIKIHVFENIMKGVESIASVVATKRKKNRKIARWWIFTLKHLRNCEKVKDRYTRSLSGRFVFVLSSRYEIFDWKFHAIFHAFENARDLRVGNCFRYQMLQKVLHFEYYMQLHISKFSINIRKFKFI